MGSSQPNRVPAREKDVAGHLNNTRLMRAFPQSANPYDGNAIFYDGSMKRADPGGKHYYVMTSLCAGPRDLLASGRRASTDRRIFVVYKKIICHCRKDCLRSKILDLELLPTDNLSCVKASPMRFCVLRFLPRAML